MLTGANQQIITAYEVEGMSPDDIATSLEFEVSAVKATLMQFSSKYREDSKTEPNLDFTIDEQLEARNAMVRLMRSSEDDYLVARLACKIRDDGKGRLDIGSNMRGLNINVVLINERIKLAQEAKRKLIGNGNTPILEAELV